MSICTAGNIVICVLHLAASFPKSSLEERCLMLKTFICLHCSKEKNVDPRSRGNQNYCGDAPCQRKRKSNWQRQRLKTGEDYRANQKVADEQWRKKRPSYWHDYRKKKHRQQKPQSHVANYAQSSSAQASIGPTRGGPGDCKDGRSAKARPTVFSTC
jgi:hypothetical protein